MGNRLDCIQKNARLFLKPWKYGYSMNCTLHDLKYMLSYVVMKTTYYGYR